NRARGTRSRALRWFSGQCERDNATDIAAPQVLAIERLFSTRSLLSSPRSRTEAAPKRPSKTARKSRLLQRNGDSSPSGACPRAGRRRGLAFGALVWVLP